MRFLHNMCVQERAVAADGVEVFNLPVNPLSVILLNIRPLNDTGTLSNYARSFALASSLNRVSVFYRGASVVNVRGDDLLALNFYRRGMLPWEANGDDTDNERRCLTLPVILGKFPYDPSSCFPASIAGELTMELDVDIADTGYDGFRYSVETVEILDAKPREYERVTSISRTFPATGLNDFQLVPGMLNRGLLLFGTTRFAGAAPAPSWGRIQVLLDNQQVGFAATDFEVVKQLGQLMGRQPPHTEYHTHRVDATAASSTQETAGGPILEEVDATGFSNYAFLDLDPNRDDAFAIDTKGSSSFMLRADVETADACRVVQVERIAV